MNPTPSRKQRKQIEELRLALHNEGTFHKENIDLYISELQFKVNEIIDYLTSQSLK